MLTSAMRWSALTLPTITALLLTLSGAPAPAQTLGPLIAGGAPGKVVETIAPAATVLSSVHYQAQLTLNCGSNVCAGLFPKPGINRRLNVTRVACRLSGTPGSAFDMGWVNLLNGRESVLLTEWLPVDFSSSAGSHTLNRAVDVQVVGSQKLFTALQLVSGGTASFGYCTVTGTLDTLG